jgi:hypothetical protein
MLNNDGRIINSLNKSAEEMRCNYLGLLSEFVVVALVPARGRGLTGWPSEMLQGGR